MANRNIKWITRKATLAVTLAGTLAIAGCNDTLTSVKNKAEHPLPKTLVSEMKAKGMSTRSPIMMRIFKEENVLEVWKQKPNGRYDIVASYEICKWSGEFGPKFKEGDRQAPEGFYSINPHQMNPNSSYYLSFNMGFPNRYDRSHGRTGSHLMIHGACSSAGCYSMTDEQVLEIFGFARDAFKGGQRNFQIQAFPFRLTAENMARHRDHKHYEFWNMIKEGYDHFEITKRPPNVNVCERKYVFNQVAENNASFRSTASCPPMSQPPALVTAYNAYQNQYEKDFAAAIAELGAEAQKQEQSLIAKLEADKRTAERAERTALRSEQMAQTVAPIAALFSNRASTASQTAATHTNDNRLSTGLYSSNATTAQVPAPAPTTVAESAPASASTVPVPVSEVAAVEETTTPPRWQFWRRAKTAN